MVRGTYNQTEQVVKDRNRLGDNPRNHPQTKGNADP